MSRTGRCKRMTKDPSKKCHQHKHMTTAQSNESPSNVVTEHVVTEQVIHSTYVRCEGTTRAGSQCSRMTMNTNKRCHHHKQLIPTSVPTSTSTSVVSRPQRETRSMNRVVETLERLQNQVREIETFARSRLIEIEDDEPEMRTESTRISNERVATEQMVTEKMITEKESKKYKSPRIRKNKSGKEEKHSHKIPSDKTEDCCVCYEPVPQNEFLDCEHPLCKNCIGQLRDTRCPMCRAEIKSKNISDKEKKKMIRRRQEDHRNRNNELFQNYIQSQNQITSVYSLVPQILPLENIHSFIAHITL